MISFGGCERLHQTRRPTPYWRRATLARGRPRSDARAAAGGEAVDGVWQAEPVARGAGRVVGPYEPTPSEFWHDAVDEERKVAGQDYGHVANYAKSCKMPGIAPDFHFVNRCKFEPEAERPVLLNHGLRAGEADALAQHRMASKP